MEEVRIARLRIPSRIHWKEKGSTNQQEFFQQLKGILEKLEFQLYKMKSGPL